MASVADESAGKSSFELWREGKATAQMTLTIRMVLAARRYRAMVDEKLRPAGQSAARMEALAVIQQAPPLSPQVEIARILRIEGPTLTRMLDSLEKDGLVERLPDPSDRRTKLLRLTDKGAETLEQIFGIVDEVRARLLEGYSAKEIEAYSVFFADMIGRIDGGLGEPA